MRAVAFLVAAVLIVGKATAARPQALDEQAQVTDLVARAKAGGYKNKEPLIGILTQPCHDCPGRWVQVTCLLNMSGGLVISIRAWLLAGATLPLAT